MKKAAKVLTCMLLVLGLPAGVLNAQTNREQSKFTLVISTEKPQVVLGSNIVITIKTTNISDELIPMELGWHGNLPDGVHYDIRDEQGNKIEKTVYHDIRPTMLPGTPISGKLAPGESMKRTATISEIYSLDPPGKYTIRVWRPATWGTPGKPDLNRVYSNTITITVLPSGRTSSAGDTSAPQ